MRYFKILVSGLIVSFLAFAQTPQEIQERIPGQLIVHHRGDPRHPAAAQMFARQQARVARVVPGLGVSVIQVAPGTEDAVAQSLRGDAQVAEVEYDHYARPAAVPNDPNYSGQWHLAKIQAATAWNRTTGSSTPIAVLDSGVDSTHPDLAGRVMAGWNFVSNNGNTADSMGHGTAVAGVLGAVTNNGLGVAAVTWQNPIMPLVVIDSSGYASYSNVAAAIQYATDHGARVISVSLGGTAASSVLQSAVDYAWNAGAVVVAAAMNNSSSTPNYPAACTNAIAVSATDENDNLAGFSDYGNWITLSAPGNNILTTAGGGYQVWSGTSLATPVAAGVAALVLAANPSLSAPALVTLLEQNSDDLGSPGYDSSFGWGRVNAARAVAAAGGSPAPPPVTSPAPPPPTVSSGTASFLKLDGSTAGNWRSAYGAEGYTVIGDSSVSPAYGSVTPSGQGFWSWNGSTSDPRALQKASASDRIAATWYTGSSYTIDVNITDGSTHQVALYCLDWDYQGRGQAIDVLNTAGNVLDSRSISGFGNGQYLVWNVSGHVIFRVRLTASWNAVVSGIFFGGQAAQPASGSNASFVKMDWNTMGNWKGPYGSYGYNIIGDGVFNPSFASVTPAGQGFWPWTWSTSDSRALQKSSASDRLAATWYSGTSFTIDVNITDGNTHQVALYCLDWDYQGRGETIDVLNGAGTVLDSRSISGFGNGVYVVWNVTGHVTFRLTRTNSWNAVLSGIFFNY